MRQFLQRAGAGVLTAVLLLSLLTVCASAQEQDVLHPYYTDVPADAWYAPEVFWALENGCMNGVAAGRFDPDGILSRAMFVTILGRAAEAGSASVTGAFSDVKADSWYAPYVAWASDLGIVQGYGNGRFGPNDPVTRQQMAVMIVRYLDAMRLPYETGEAGAAPFADAAEIADWAVSSVRALQASGILTGDEKGRFRPGQSTTRAQAAAVLHRMLQQDNPEQETPADRIPERSKWMEFCTALFRLSAKSGSNTLVSPVSALYALSMAENGAQGTTLAQMEQATGLSRAELNALLQAYRASLPQEKDLKVCLANSVWMKDGSVLVQPSYLETVKKLYQAEAFTRPFDEAARQEINAWVDRNTDGMIPDFLKELKEEDRMLLISALYFDAKWQSVYWEDQVSEGDFTTQDGRKQTVEYLNDASFLPYIRGEDTTGFLRSYAGYRDEKTGEMKYHYVFAALLPKEGMPMSEYVDSLTGEKLLELVTGAEIGPRVISHLPKFQYSADCSLTESLEKLGICDAFRDEADFSNMGTAADGPLKFAHILQKTKIAVDRDGTRAAAATGIIMNVGSALAETVEVNLNRPFVYAILDMDTGLPLFIGTVEDFSAMD